MKLIKWFCTHPFIIALVALAVIVSMTPPDDLLFIRETVGGGALIKIFTALIAGLTLMALVKLAMLMRVLFTNGNPNGIFKDPVAKAILLSGFYIAFALLVSSIFG